MAAGLRLDAYGWQRGREPLLRFGPDTGPAVIVALPLFEEANRTRAIAVAVLRTLSARGIGGLLPELPGQGESLIPTQAATLADLRAAFAAAATSARARRTYGLAIRSGALIEAPAVLAGRWRLSPVAAGRDMVRELSRTRQAATGERLDPDCLPPAGNDAVEVAGNLLSFRLLAELAGSDANPVDAAPLRTARLANDGQAADLLIPAPPPWRRSEPEADAALVEAIARDVAEWIGWCEG